MAPLWPLHGANLGTLLRTCDAVGARLVVPRLPWINSAPARGDTLRRRSCVHRITDPLRWLEHERGRGSHLLGVELADDACSTRPGPPPSALHPRGDLEAARRRTVVVLGHEQDGIPAEACELLDEVVEIPMVGTGTTLNVAVSGSLVAYRLAGLL